MPFTSNRIEPDTRCHTWCENALTLDSHPVKECLAARCENIRTTADDDCTLSKEGEAL